MGRVHLQKWMKKHYKELTPSADELKLLVLSKELEKRGIRLDFLELMDLLDEMEKRAEKKLRVVFCHECKHYNGKRENALGIVGFCRLLGRKVMLPSSCLDGEEVDKHG